MAFTPAPKGDQIGATDRVLPNDQQAEQSVLGGMLLSQDAVADVFEYIGAHDFYAPKHELIFSAIYSLYGRGEPTDVITVTAELTRTGSLVRAGGADYLHSLTSVVPTAANAGFYAKIVQEKAVLRRLVEAEEVPDLVDERHADLLDQLAPQGLLDRGHAPGERLRGRGDGVVAAGDLRSGHATG